MRLEGDEGGNGMGAGMIGGFFSEGVVDGGEGELALAVAVA